MMTGAQDRTNSSNAQPGAPDAEPVIKLCAVEHYYEDSAGRLEILSDINMALYPGSTVALVAPSGAGKSTLLHICGLLERPKSGEVWINGHCCKGLADGERTRIRRENIGFIYQFHHLLPEFSAKENIVLPQLIAGASRQRADMHADELLTYMRINERASHRPGQLSGGERQRVAIARALANAPRILLADEPSGNLDPETASHVFSALLRLARASRIAALVATHNLALAKTMDFVLTLKDKKLVELKID